MRFTLRDLVEIAAAADAVERLRAELAEFVEQHGAETGVADFLDIPTGSAFDVKPEDAIRFFQTKGLRPTFHYADMLREEQAQAFTVAKMMDVDLLGQVRASLDAALDSGQSFADWKKTIGPVLQSAGWWGRQEMTDPLTGARREVQLGSAWRLETIFRTNMQTAYAVGQWQEIEEQADLAPFLLYDAVDDFRTRPLHKALDQTVLPVQHDFWRTHYPPNGYNCRCGVIQLTASDLSAMGLSVTGDPPNAGFRMWENPRTGKRERVPLDVDPGFAHNPGITQRAELQRLLREKVGALPDDGLRQAAEKATRREFDGQTEAGKWHLKSFDEAPDWLREKVLDEQAVEVEYGKDGAFARGGRLINMGPETFADAHSQSTWRHEMGHIIDYRVAGGRGLYRSSLEDFEKAQDKDAAELKRAAGAGRASKAQDTARARAEADAQAARERVIDADRADREQVLRELAADAGLELAALLQVVRESTLILEGVELESVGAAARIAGLISAIKHGDAERFLVLATFKDDKAQLLTVHKTWRKDGALAALSDLVGSATRNKVASYHRGFYGHSDTYYKRAGYMSGTESFANLTALAGHRNPYWWELAKRFTPRMAALYETIIKGNAP